MFYNLINNFTQRIFPPSLMPLFEFGHIIAIANNK